jgi:hypothetical protein
MVFTMSNLIREVVTLQFSATSEPHINWHHADGPMLCCSDGSLHWLTLRERFGLWCGWLNIEHLNVLYKIGGRKNVLL